MPKSFRASTEHYLKQWCNLDRQLFFGFSQGPVTCELLAKMCNAYQVARTVPGHNEERYNRFAEMLNNYRHTEVTRQTVPEIIEHECRSMHEAYGKSLLSAITKAFWMMKRHPVVIYDSNVRRGLARCGLQSGTNNYGVYFDSWFKFFERKDVQHSIDEAMAWLAASPQTRSLLRKQELTHAQLRELVGSQWFRNRVADMRLFYIGRD